MQSPPGFNAQLFLRDTTAKLDGLRQASIIYEPQIAPRFSLIGLLAPNENDLSRLLADLLSPSGSHSQGGAFLSLFLSHFGFQETWAEPASAFVETEAATFNGRRIDVKITFTSDKGSGAIGIENKPWAADQKDQVSDYVKDLERKHGGRHALIYLSATGAGPSEWSSGTRDAKTAFPSLRVIGYGDLIGWLKQCCTVCKASRIKVLLDELIDYIEKEFNGVREMNERTMIMEEACKAPNNLQAAFAIANALNDIKTSLLDKLWAEFRALAAHHHPEWIIEVTFDRPESSKWRGLKVGVAPNDSYHIYLEFEQYNCNGAAIGIAKRTKEIADKPELSAILNRVCGNGQQSEYWPWWRNFSPYRWGDNAEAWLSIQNGEMAHRIFAEFEAIYDALKDNDALKELN